ncbi:UNVERIFIED_CONTAM: hypothetical protein P3C79_27375, partial [Pseudomonas aeruginosa]
MILGNSIKFSFYSALKTLRERIRYLHYSLRTEQAYVHWVRAFI